MALGLALGIKGLNPKQEKQRALHIQGRLVVLQQEITPTGEQKDMQKIKEDDMSQMGGGTTRQKPYWMQ